MSKKRLFLNRGNSVFWHLYKKEELSLVDVNLHEMEADHDIAACIMAVDSLPSFEYISNILQILNKGNCKHLTIYGKYWNRIRKICKRNNYSMEIAKERKRGGSLADVLDNVCDMQFGDKRERKHVSNVYLISNDMGFCHYVSSYLGYIDRTTCDVVMRPVEGEELLHILRKHLFDYYYADIELYTIHGEKITGRVTKVLKDSEHPECYSGLLIRKADGTSVLVYVEDIEDFHIQKNGQWPYSEQMIEFIDLMEKGTGFGTDFRFDPEKIPLEQR